MLGQWIIFFVCLVFGIFNTIWPQKAAEYTWIVRHGIDDDGRRSIENGLRFVGIMFIFISIMILWVIV